MRLKFVMPDDPLRRIAIYQEQLRQINDELPKILLQKMQISQEMLILRAREKAGHEVGSEISACHRKELHVRMAELAAGRQRKKLQEAISLL